MFDTEAHLTDHQRRALPVAERWRDHRRRYQEEGRRQARIGDAFHQAGCMLYWAEGTKNRNTASIVNSDVHLVRFFRRFVTECFGASSGDFTVRVHAYVDNGLSIERIERYWLDALELPRAVLRRHRVNVRPASSRQKRDHKLPYGVCTLGVNRSTRLIQHIYGAIQEYGGFVEPRWLG
jgi:hypothetical protein